MDQTDDLERLYDLVLAAGAEIYDAVPDKESLLAYITNLRDSLVDSVIILLYYNDEIAGYVAASVTLHPFFITEKMAVEHGWYVVPEHRTKYSLKLMDAFESWAKLIGCKRTAVGHYGHDERMPVVYKRKKYKPIEVVYMKELN